MRAGVFAAVCVLLAALGHASMSDAPVPWWVVLGAIAVTAGGAWCLAGRERGPLFVTALTVSAQAALHTAFSFGQSVMGWTAGRGGSGMGAGASAGGGSGGGEQMSSVMRWAASSMCGAGAGPGALTGTGADHMAMHHHMSSSHLAGVDGMTGMDGMSGMDGMASMGDMASMGGMHGSMSGMAAAHLLVALLSAWWLCGGERAAFRVARAVSARVFIPLVVVFRVMLPVAAPPARTVRREPRRPLRQLFLVHAIWLRGPPQGTAVC
ncbi:PE-PGRS family protein [Streptomyces sp. MST-110588]|uniref:PE-PGRS family protein n=1 Tax=Streptomyces sp. MST-110588 TaxID=2833628 RepID=UPI00324291F3